MLIIKNPRTGQDLQVESLNTFTSKEPTLVESPGFPQSEADLGLNKSTVAEVYVQEDLVSRD